MENVKNAVVQKIEAKYKKAMAELQEKTADAKIQAEKLELETKMKEAKEKAEDMGEDLKNKLNNAWNKFEAKYKELVK